MPEHTSFLDILVITGPIFLIIVIGFASVRLGAFPKAGVGMLGTFAINFALPAMLFKVLSERSLDEIIHPTYLLAYSLGSLAALAIGLIIANRFRGKNLTTSTIMGMGSSVSNSGFIGYPVLLQLLGPAALVPLALTLIVETVIMIPVGLALADSGADRESQFLKALLKAMMRLLKRPLILSIFLGILCAALELKPPSVITEVVNTFAMSAGAVALFVIGGSLVGLKIRGKVLDISQILICKLLVHPLAVLCVLLLLPPIDWQYQTAAVVLASMPMFSIFPILGQKYGLEDICAAALVLTTALSFVTIGISIWFLGTVDLFG